MPTEKPAIDTTKLRETMQEGERVKERDTQEVQYRAIMEQVSEGVQKLEQQIRASNYESLPSKEEVDTLLSLVSRAGGTLPEGHPSREQYAVQEKAALEIIENIKNSRRYLQSLKRAEEDIGMLGKTFAGKEGMSQILRGSEHETEAERKERVGAMEMAEDQLEKILADFKKPIFRTLPENHPLRRKHAAREKEIQELLQTTLQESGGAVELKSGDSFFGPGRPDDTAKTLPDVKFDPAKELVPDELKDTSTAPIPSPSGARHVPKKESGGQDPEDAKKYRERMSLLLQHMATLEDGLRKANEIHDLERLNGLLGDLWELDKEYAAINRQFGEPAIASDEYEFKTQYDALFEQLNSYGNSVSSGRKKGLAQSASMPRVPAPPYRMRYMNAGRRGAVATLAATPAPAPVPATPLPDVDVHARSLPPLPENIAAKSEDEKLAYLEQLLIAFQTEHTRLVNEHDELVKKLTEQVKERKLQALRDSLK